MVAHLVVGLCVALCDAHWSALCRDVWLRFVFVQSVLVFIVSTLARVGVVGPVAVVALACDANHAYVALRREHHAVDSAEGQRAGDEGGDREALGVLVISLKDCAIVARWGCTS